MHKSTTVKEGNYEFWRMAAIISAILSVITFVIFWNIEAPFWVSITRLVAFVFFAATILCYLQIMNGPIQISITVSNNLVVVSYYKNDKKIQEEEFKKKTIKEIYTTTSGINFLLVKFQPSIKSFKVSFTDTEKDLYLFEFSGRPLLFGKTSQEKVLQLFKDPS